MRNCMHAPVIWQRCTLPLHQPFQHFAWQPDPHAHSLPVLVYSATVAPAVLVDVDEL